MNDEPTINGKIKSLKVNYKLVRDDISRWNNYSLTIKNWAVTVWSIIIIFLLTQYYSQETIKANFSYFLLFPISLIIAFWFIDALFKKFERFSIARSEAIEDYLNDSFPIKSEEKFKEKMEKLNKQNKTAKTQADLLKEFKGKFPTYDAVGRISRGFAFYEINYEYITKFRNCFLVRIVAYLYCILMILTFSIFAVVTLNLYILIINIFPVIIWIISWRKSKSGIF